MQNFARMRLRILSSFLGYSFDGGGSGYLPLGVEPRSEQVEDVGSSLGGVLRVASSLVTSGGGGVRVPWGLTALFGGVRIRSRACSKRNLARFRRCRGLSPIRQKSEMRPGGHRRKLSWERTGAGRWRAVTEVVDTFKDYGPLNNFSAFYDLKVRSTTLTCVQ